MGGTGYLYTMVPRVTYSVRFGVSLEAIPEGARREIDRTMRQIADVLGSVPTSSPFWGSMKDSLLQIDVEGWRVVYRIDAAAGEVRVVELAQIRP